MLKSSNKKTLNAMSDFFIRIATEVDDTDNQSKNSFSTENIYHSLKFASNVFFQYCLTLLVVGYKCRGR